MSRSFLQSNIGVPEIQGYRLQQHAAAEIAHSLTQCDFNPTPMMSEALQARLLFVGSELEGSEQPSILIKDIDSGLEIS